MKNTLTLGIFLAFLLAITVSGQETPSSSATQQKPLTELLAQALQSYRTGKFDAATEQYQTALRQDPKSGEAYAGLARTYLKQENVQTAFETAQNGVTQAPDSLAAHTALGEVCFRKGKMEESEKEFLKAVNTPHPEARAYLGLARLYAAFSLHAKAEKELQKAHALDPDDPDIQRRWVGTLTRAQRIQSLEEYLSASKNNDSDTREQMQWYLDLLKEREKHKEKSCTLVTKLTATEARLKQLLSDAKHLRGYGLEVNVNGQSSRLLLDTGASGLLINRKMADKAAIKQLVSVKMGGFGDKGPAGGYIGYADSIKVGNLEFQNCPVYVSEQRSIVGEDGLIGADVFSRYLVTIDFPSEKLKLQELPRRPDEQEQVTTLSTTEDEDDDETPSAPEEKETKKRELNQQLQQA